MNLKDKNSDVPYSKNYLSTQYQSFYTHISIYALDTETHDVIKIRKQDAYCKQIKTSLHIPSVKNKFSVKDDTLFKII